MAPMQVAGTALPSKRPSSHAGFAEPASKRDIPFRHHALKWRDTVLGTAPHPFQDGSVIENSLIYSISLALEAVGFKGADQLALESFRLEVEEYMAHFLATVRQSMLSCRRTQTLPQDYLRALDAHQLTLRALLPHLDPPISPSKSQRLVVRDQAEDSDAGSKQFSLPSTSLGETHEDKYKYRVPSFLPPFPSKHTYKATPEFPTREQDARKIRERATEEGRLGEEALRKLVGAGSEQRLPGRDPSKRNGRAERENKWRETMEALMTESNGGGASNSALLPNEISMLGVPATEPATKAYLNSFVNADKVNWRKGGGPTMAEPQGFDRNTTSQ